MNDQQAREQLDIKSSLVKSGLCPLCERPYRREAGVGRCDHCRIDTFVAAGVDCGNPFFVVQWDAWPGESLPCEKPAWREAGSFPALSQRIELRP